MSEYESILLEVIGEVEDSCNSVFSFFSTTSPIRISPALKRAISYRSNCVSSLEKRNYEALVTQTGLYKNIGLADGERLCLILVGDDIKKYVMPSRLERFCQAYRSDFPVFQACPALFSLVRDDLVAMESAILDESGQLVQFPGFLCRLPCLIPGHAALYQYLFKIKGSAELFLRIDPHDDAQSKVVNIFEEAMIPADPKFIETLSIFRGEKKTAAYEVVEPANISERISAFWDYHNGYGRLEVVFKRHGSEKILSCMAEEIPREVSGRVLTGLCLHATSKCPPGTPWESAVADHIDGAVNYYFDETGLERLESNVFNAECDASCRTHLFRINNVSLSQLLPISYHFFAARSLWEDWIKDQFRLVKRDTVSGGG